MRTVLRVDKHFTARWRAVMRQASGHGGFASSCREEKKSRIKRAQYDQLYFAQTYFPDFFSVKFAPFHKEWNLLAEKRNEIVQLLGFRGCGKSTFFTLATSLHAIVYGTKKYLLFAGYTVEKSLVHTMRILAEAHHNPRLCSDFGTPETGQKAEIGWSELVYEQHSCMVQALSVGQDPRGLIYGAYRPDFARLDDIQEDKRARNRKFVRDTCDWIVARLIPAMAWDYNCIVLSTPLNEGCVAMSLEAGTYAPKVQTYRYPAEKNGSPTWQSIFSVDRLKNIKDTVGSLVYAQEYNLVPRRNEDVVFRMGDILRMAYTTPPTSFDVVISWTDPSAKQNESGNVGRDYKATVVVGLAGAEMYVLDARIRNESVGQMIGGMYILYRRWNIATLWWEDNGGQALLQNIFDDEAEKRGIKLPLRAKTNTLNKNQRIEQTLSAHIESGAVRFPLGYEKNSDIELLIDQLVQFPGADYDDGPDALEGAVRMLIEWQHRQRAWVPVSGARRSSRDALKGYM